jgi:hypothetical protein
VAGGVVEVTEVVGEAADEVTGGGAEGVVGPEREDVAGEFAGGASAEVGKRGEHGEGREGA